MDYITRQLLAEPGTELVILGGCRSPEGGPAVGARCLHCGEWIDEDAEDDNDFCCGVRRAYVEGRR